jgi:succinate-semialdehyde dehydrogenase / glutarate-semialdehyde dehydrogenase
MYDGLVAMTVSETAVTAGHAEQILIGGRWLEATDGDRFDVTDPATGDVVGSVPNAAEADVKAAIDAAAGALGGWRSLAAIERGRILRRSADILRERKDETGAVMTAEQGKPLAEAVGEVEYAASFLEWFAGEAERAYGQVVPPMSPENRVLVLRQPVGVVAAITPWNFPAAMMTRKLGPAMAAGCTSIVKPASATPLTAALVLRAIEDAGAPPGVVNLVTSRSAGMVAETLFGDPRVRKISFTGSTEVGKELIRLSANQVKRLSLELGGHAPYIVFEDTDLDPAVDGLIASKYRNAGQTCVCANRVFVQRSIYDDFVARLAEKVGRMVVGPGTKPGVTIGPLIDERAVDKVEEHVRDAIGRGARLVVGGERLTSNGFQGGSYYAPTVLADVTREMLMSTEETFGPVAGLAPFETEEDAIRLANDSVYGLAAYFHTRDYARLLRVAEGLDYGIVGVNSGIISAANVPFGGVKESGYGREGGAFGIDEYLDVKYVLVGAVVE